MSRNVNKSKLYAYGTDVSVQNSQFEIQRTLARFNAHGFAFMKDPRQGARRAMVLFQVGDRKIRFDVPEPDVANAPKLNLFEARKDAEERRLWRSLAMAVKAKLDIINSGIATFEEEFLPYTLVDTTMTFYEASKRPEFLAQIVAARPIALGPGAPEGVGDAPSSSGQKPANDEGNHVRE